MGKKRRGRKRIYPLNRWSTKTVVMLNGQQKIVHIKPNLEQSLDFRKTKYRKRTVRGQPYKRLGKWSGHIDAEIIAALDELQNANVEYSILLREYQGKKFPEFRNKYEFTGLEGTDQNCAIHKRNYNLNTHTHPSRSFEQLSKNEQYAKLVENVKKKMLNQFPHISPETIETRLEYFGQNIWDDVPSAEDLAVIITTRKPMLISTPHYNITLTKDNSVKIFQGTKYLKIATEYHTSLLTAKDVAYLHLSENIPNCQSLQDVDQLIENECKKYQQDRATHVKQMRLRMIYHKKTDPAQPIKYQS